MSRKDLVEIEIIKSPEHYFNAQSKSLESRLDEVKISKEEENEISKSNLKKFIRDKTLGIFKVGEIISEIINWNEKVDEDIKEAKKQYLLSQYFDRNDRNEIALNSIKEFLSNAQGNTLFNKILRILDDTPPDRELSNHLANALNYIASSDFKGLFEEHKYALSQIEKLTPQSLTILSDSNSWPIIKLGNYTASGSRVTSDWLVEFTNAYALSKQIDNHQITKRISHSINELISMRLIEAHLTQEGGARCNITDVGKILLPYISK